jgi:hypothetical protein
MPVSFFPLLLPALFIFLLIRGAYRGRRALVRAIVIVVCAIAVVLLPFYIRGWWLMFRSARGDAQAMYELARWHENHCESIGELILWPCEADVESGYKALERSAAAGYPPAMFALGVRLKYGLFVPGSATEGGQPWIDRAIQGGFRSPVPEEQFYFRVYRQDYSGAHDD